MTPAETFLSLEAALWREERRQRAEVTAAWLTAKLSRAKRIPALKILLADSRPQKSSPAELAQRGQEFREMTNNLDLTALNKQKGKD